VVTEDSEPVTVELEQQDLGSDDGSSDVVQSATVGEPADQITLRFANSTAVSDEEAAIADTTVTADGEAVEITGIQSGETTVTVSLNRSIRAGESVELGHSPDSNQPTIVVESSGVGEFTVSVENNVGS